MDKLQFLYGREQDTIIIYNIHIQTKMKFYFSKTSLQCKIMVYHEHLWDFAKPYLKAPWSPIILS